MEARELGFLEGNLNPSVRKQLKKKWSKLVEGISDPRIAENTAMLLENEMTHMKQVLTEAMTTSNVAEYTKFIFPLIRNVWPSSIANHTVSVQPMDGPVGAIGYYQPRYGTTKGTITAGQAFPVDLRTGAINFDSTYSRAGASVTGESIGTGNSTSLVFYKVLANGEISPGSLTITNGGVTATDDTRGNITGTGISAGMINYETGQIMIAFTAAYTPYVGSAIAAAYEYLIESTQTGVSQIYGDLTIDPVRPVSRKLTSLYSAEVVEDMKALWGQDAEAELVASMANQVTLEVDREIIYGCLSNVPASHADTWAATYDSTSATKANIAQVDFYRTLVTKLSKISQLVYTATLRNPANWIVCSTDIIPVLDQLPEFTGVAPNSEYQLGIQKVGTLSNKWTVFADPFMASGTVLLGLKGQAWPEAGAVYAPYIPLQLTPTFFNPATFQMSKGIRTRYAFKIVNPYYFGKVTVSGL
jgi:hypothetical protein